MRPCLEKKIFICVQWLYFSNHQHLFLVLRISIFFYHICSYVLSCPSLQSFQYMKNSCLKFLTGNPINGVIPAANLKLIWYRYYLFILCLLTFHVSQDVFVAAECQEFCPGCKELRSGGLGEVLTRGEGKEHSAVLRSGISLAKSLLSVALSRGHHKSFSVPHTSLKQNELRGRD